MRSLEEIRKDMRRCPYTQCGQDKEDLLNLIEELKGELREERQKEVQDQGPGPRRDL